MTHWHNLLFSSWEHRNGCRNNLEKITRKTLMDLPLAPTIMLCTIHATL